MGPSHQLDLWVFSSGALDVRLEWRPAGSPRSRLVGCSAGVAGHCLDLKAAQLLLAGGPGQGRVDGQALASQHRDRQQIRMGPRYTVEYYSAIKKNAICREIIMLSKNETDSERNMLHIFSHSQDLPTPSLLC